MEIILFELLTHIKQDLSVVCIGKFTVTVNPQVIHFDGNFCLFTEKRGGGSSSF